MLSVLKFFIHIVITLYRDLTHIEYRFFLTLPGPLIFTWGVSRIGLRRSVNYFDGAFQAGVGHEIVVKYCWNVILMIISLFVLHNYSLIQGWIRCYSWLIFRIHGQLLLLTRRNQQTWCRLPFLNVFLHFETVISWDAISQIQGYFILRFTHL